MRRRSLGGAKTRSIHSFSLISSALSKALIVIAKARHARPLVYATRRDAMRRARSVFFRTRERASYADEIDVRGRARAKSAALVSARGASGCRVLAESIRRESTVSREQQRRSLTFRSRANARSRRGSLPCARGTERDGEKERERGTRRRRRRRRERGDFCARRRRRRRRSDGRPERRTKKRVVASAGEGEVCI